MITRALDPVPHTLAEWAERLGADLVRGDPRATVSELTDDSREAGPDDLFFARRGSETDGARFAAAAVAAGAAAVVGAVDPGHAIPFLRVADPDTALRFAADVWYGRPQDALDLVGVTGTKGKSTTAELIAAALRAAGRRTALLGTIRYDVGDGRTRPAPNTTPGALALRRLLAAARDAGCTAAVLEVSSHALDQGRTDGLDFRVAVFTNLGRDHLDYHESLDAYFEAKRVLFRGLGADATAILNRDDARWWALAGDCRGRVLTYGLSAESDLRADALRLGAEETTFRLMIAGEGEVDVRTSLVGRHNALNVLAAIGAARGLGLDLVTAVEGVEAVAGVRGRLERVGSLDDDVHVFVDYAHTEQALREVLGFLAEVGATPVTCVVGCGGDRDRGKRPGMARAAAELSARALLTSDNPRTEDPAAILREMEAGLTPGLAEKSETVPDRGEAIRRAVMEAPSGSCVLVAGKGHEDYQILGTRKVHFDDAEEVQRALALRAGASKRAEARAGRRAD